MRGISIPHGFGSAVCRPFSREFVQKDPYQPKMGLSTKKYFQRTEKS
jgi:hypothetical protein